MKVKNCINSAEVIAGDKARSDFRVVEESIENYKNNKHPCDKPFKPYMISEDGIPRKDLSLDVRRTLERADEAYMFPKGGIPLKDLSKSVQDLLNGGSSASKEDIELLKQQVQAIMEYVGMEGEFITEILNVEEETVQDFMSRLYDNNNYGYSYSYNGMGSYPNNNAESCILAYRNFEDTHVPKFWIPNSKVISTYNGDTLELSFADYTQKKTISLDVNENTYKIINLIPGKTYIYKVYKNNNVVNKGKIKVEGQVRFLQIESNPNANVPNADGSTNHYHRQYIGNVRDLGGWKTDNGKQIAYGILFRGEQMDSLRRDVNTQEPVNLLTAEGKQRILDLGITGDLDVRNLANDNRPSAMGEQVERKCVSLTNFGQFNIYTRLYNILNNSFVQAFREMLIFLRAGKKVYTHCEGGCDRTGAFFAVLEGILGVSENDINKDYELSLRTRNAEMYTLYRLDKTREDARSNNSYDSDFKFAMEFIKNLKVYNNVAYTKVRSYIDSTITINNVVYSREGTVVKDDTRYCKWVNDNTAYYTLDVYPTTSSKIYTMTSGDVTLLYEDVKVKIYTTTNAVFNETNLHLTANSYYYYYNARGGSSHARPIAITDINILNALENIPTNTLKDAFRIFIQKIPSSDGTNNTGLTDSEIEEFENYLLV